jgi:hypothetical protein
MTDLEVYAPQLLDRHTDGWTAVLVSVAELADTIAKTDLVPKALRGNPAAITAVILRGREVGFAPMTSLAHLYVINGNVGIKAEGMRALVLAAGHEIGFSVSNGASATCRGRRKGTSEWYEVTWTQEMARAAKLLPGAPGSGWAVYPRAMYKARSSTELCRDVFPDVIGGLQSVEELEDGPLVDVAERRPTRRATTTVQRVGPTDEPDPFVLPPMPTAEDPAPDPLPITDEQRTAIHAAFGALQMPERDDKLHALSTLLDREVDTSNDLTLAEASQVLTILSHLQTMADPPLELLGLLERTREATGDEPGVPG